MTRRAALTWGLLWFGLASAVFVGIVAGFLILRLLAPDVAIAASRPVAQPTAPVDVSRSASAARLPGASLDPALVPATVSGDVRPVGAPAPSASQRITAAASASPRAASMTGHQRSAAFQPSAVPSATASKPAGVSGSAVVGVASWMPERYGAGYLALPGGAGLTVRICAATCLVMTSVDAGPSLAMQRAGRVADVGVLAWEAICGLPRAVGLCSVSVETVQ